MAGIRQIRQEDFQEEMISDYKNIPPMLLPYVPLDPKVDDPTYMLPIPRIHKFRHGGAINLDPIKFRDMRGHYHFCPIGLPCDGGSYPWIARNLLRLNPYDKETLRTYWLHNKNYTLHDYYPEWPTYVSRTRADKMMHDGLNIELPWMADTAYFFVHFVGGRLVWDHINKEAIMKEWLVKIEESDYELRKWVDNLIEQDEAA